MNNVHVTVFLVSLKAGGVALNLTEASRVYRTSLPSSPPFPSISPSTCPRTTSLTTDNPASRRTKTPLNQLLAFLLPCNRLRTIGVRERGAHKRLVRTYSGGTALHGVQQVQVGGGCAGL